MNFVFEIGNLTRDPEMRQTQKGENVCTFTIAVNRRNREEADFLNIVTWNGLAENCYRYLKKGRKVAVVGSIRTGSYEKDGRTVHTTDINASEVEFLSGKEKVQDDNSYDFY